MARQQTAADERTAQNHELVEQVAGELGLDHVTIKVAQEHRRKERQVPARIKARDLDLSDVDVVPIGVVIAQVQDYKIMRGTTATLALATSAFEFGDVIHDAARLSPSRVLVCALYEIPRHLGLDEDDDGVQP